jgi:hypothetical protein
LIACVKASGGAAGESGLVWVAGAAVRAIAESSQVAVKREFFIKEIIRENLGPKKIG